MNQTKEVNVNCPTHNKKITHIDVKKGTLLQNRIKCSDCIASNDGLPVNQAIEKFQKFKEDEKQQLRKYRINKIYDFSQFQKNIKQLSESISQSLNEISKQVNERIEKIVEVIQFAQNVQWQFNREEYMTLIGLQTIGEVLSLADRAFTIENAGYSVVQKKKEEQLQSTLLNYQNNIKVIQKNMEELKESLTTNLIINEEIVGKVEQKEKCLATAFNKDNNLMIGTADELIKLWKFENGTLKLLYTLKGHEKDVTCLYFSKKSNWFVSGSRDKTIRIWKEYSTSEWGCTQILEGNNYCINCIVMNSSEEQIITSRDDNKIKVWMLDLGGIGAVPSWKCCQTLEDHKKDVYSLCFNKSGTMFVSGSYDKTAIIWEIDENKQWKVKQVLTNDYENWVHSVCVMNDQMISVKLYNGIVLIFQYQETTQAFEQIQEIELSKSKMNFFDFFHMFYNEPLQSIFCRHLDSIYILIEQGRNYKEPSQLSGRYAVQQKITDNYRGGSLTDNGEYIVLWNNSTKYIEARQQE